MPAARVRRGRDLHVRTRTSVDAEMRWFVAMALQPFNPEVAMPSVNCFWVMK